MSYSVGRRCPMRPPGSPQDLERRRLRAIELLKEDHPPGEVARIVGCDRRSVRRGNAAFRKGGGGGLQARPTPGRPPPLGGEGARIVGGDRGSVRRWNAAFRKGGGEGLKARPTPGRPPRLDEKAKRRLEKALLNGAKA